jgi:hypothetical protein
MIKCIMTILPILAISCSNVAINPSPDLSDQQAIEAISGKITDMPIDSISTAENGRVIVYYKSDSINDYVTFHGYLWVYDSQTIDSSFRTLNHVREGKWMSDPIYLTTYRVINMYSDSIPFEARTYDKIPIDSLRIFLRFLRDSTAGMCNSFGCIENSLDSIDAISWYHEQDTIVIEMTQAEYHSGIVYTFRWFKGSILRWLKANWT